MGIRVARKMLDRRVLEFQPLGSGIAMTEIVVGAKLMTKQLSELSFYGAEGVQILGFKRGSSVQASPSGDQRLEIGDVVIVVGPEATLVSKLKSL